MIRFALQINPLTAQVEVSPTGSEPIPHIIKGIVTHVRTIRVYVDRPDFIKNPTSCEHMQLQNTVSGGGADPSNPADQTSVLVSSPFQAADCASLQFKPSFTASTPAQASKGLGASLTVKLTYPKAPEGTQANIRYVKVELPKRCRPSSGRCSTHVSRRCSKKAPRSAPNSIVGHATAVTPILPVPSLGERVLRLLWRRAVPRTDPRAEGLRGHDRPARRNVHRARDITSRRSRPSRTSPSRASN